MEDVNTSELEADTPSRWEWRLIRLLRGRLDEVLREAFLGPRPPSPDSKKVREVR